MPRYFFNIRHDKANLDYEGIELPDKYAAWEAATVKAGNAIKNIDGALRPGHDWRLEVTDEFANVLWLLDVKAQKK